MPSVIPYDPSLALGNIVSLPKLNLLKQISALQTPADVAEDELNSLITLRRSFDMTMQELMDMDIDTASLAQERDTVNTQLKAAAQAYAKAKLDSEKAIQPLKARIRTVSGGLESPLDYNRTQIKKMPLSADSMKMNVQYFSYDRNAQTSGTHAATVSSFVSDEVSELGNTIQGQVSASVQAQTNSQHARHEIAGTLVISVICTHKDAALLAPLILDVDKAIRVWNQIFPDQMIKTNSPENLANIAQTSSTPDEKSFTLISGATYGSCFIGMVHVLNTTDTQNSEQMYSVATKLQAQLDIGAFLEKERGGFGVDSSFSDDAKNLLSTQNVSAHCSLVTMGSIPTITASNVEMGVQAFADDDASKSMAALMKLQSATVDAQTSVDSSAKAARTGGEFVALQNAKITGALSALSAIDKATNSIIDTNSMMSALQDYVKKCLGGNVGVPITYYLKPITRSQLAQMWVGKYFPGRYTTIAGDDSGIPGGNQSGGNSAAPPPAADTSNTDSGGGQTQ